MQMATPVASQFWTYVRQRVPHWPRKSRLSYGETMAVINYQCTMASHPLCLALLIGLWGMVGTVRIAITVTGILCALLLLRCRQPRPRRQLQRKLRRQLRHQLRRQRHLQRAAQAPGLRPSAIHTCKTFMASGST
jgi:hypothetical protein